MARTAGMSLFFGLALAACGVGDEGDDFVPDPIDPNPNRVTCSGMFKLTGSFTPGTPARPAEVPTGCWPVGAWTFTAALDATTSVPDVTGDGVGDRCGEVTGTTAPTVAPSYSFRVDRTPLIDDNGTPGDTTDDAVIGWDEKYTYTGDMTNFLEVDVSEGGGGECEGTVEMLSADKRAYWIMKASQRGTAIDGFGEYTLFIDPQPL